MAVSLYLARGRRQLLLALAALACAAPASPALAATTHWAGGEQVNGSGAIRSQTRALGHFSGVSMGIAGSVEVRLGSSESITIETDDNLLPLIDTAIEGGTLQIRAARKNIGLVTQHMKIVVQARSVERLALGGSGTIDAELLRGPKLQFDLGGSGSISVKAIDSDAVAVALGGSGSFKAAGRADSVSVSIGGSGDVQLGKLRAANVSVNVAGSGQATVWARDTLSLNIAGSGDVNYYGEPKLSKTVIGSGGARRLGAAPQ